MTEEIDFAMFHTCERTVKEVRLALGLSLAGRLDNENELAFRGVMDDLLTQAALKFAEQPLRAQLVFEKEKVRRKLWLAVASDLGIERPWLLSKKDAKAVGKKYRELVHDWQAAEANCEGERHTADTELKQLLKADYDLEEQLLEVEDAISRAKNKEIRKFMLAALQSSSHAF